MDYNYFLPAGTPVSFKRGTYGYSLETRGFSFSIGETLLYNQCHPQGKAVQKELKPGYYIMNGTKIKKGKEELKIFYSSYKNLRLGEQICLSL